ncbi:MAG TPA: hypothetical protein VF173_28475 [Thermoanaerobaculia bacterium]|nr:hypothetical protein [Thermoanaerobaculia bacterium]
MAHALSAEDLLASGATTHTVALPAALLAGVADAAQTLDGRTAGEVVLRPLLVRDVDRVVRAAKEQRVLTSVLLVQQALVAPKMTVEQVGSLPAGLVQFLSEKVNALSGLTLGEDDLERAVKAPLARACFVLAREFGWTPGECSELTVGQVLLYLEMLARDEHAPLGTGAA